MAGGLKGRLARLEKGRTRGGRCGVCGWSPDGPISFNIPMPRLIGEPPGPDDDPSLDACRACGRRLVFRVPPPKAVAAGGELRLESGA